MKENDRNLFKSNTSSIAAGAILNFEPTTATSHRKETTIVGFEASYDRSGQYTTREWRIHTTLNTFIDIALMRSGI